MKIGDMIRAQDYRSELCSEGCIRIELWNEDQSNISTFLEENETALIISQNIDDTGNLYFEIFTNSRKRGWVLESMIEVI